MAFVRRVDYSSKRRCFCERCGTHDFRNYDYRIPMKGSTPARLVFALVCEPCANRVAELAFLDVPALDERTLFGSTERKPNTAVLSALESDEPDVGA